jgi:hypothetical protein
MTVDPLAIQGIMALVSGGVASLITQLLKGKIQFFASGVGAVVLTALACLACTAIYFQWVAPAAVSFTLVNFAIYSVVVFGEATGFYHLTFGS